MSREEFVVLLKSLPKGYAHAKNILAKEMVYRKLNQEQQEALLVLGERYMQFFQQNQDTEVIKDRVHVLNEYYNFFERYDRLFTSQGKLRSTILEEFMFILFRGIVEERRAQITEAKRGQLGLGNTNAYSNLYFTGAKFNSFIENPTIAVNTKNQDFAIYRSIELNGEAQRLVLNVPIIAIENKTYLDKTMLEGAIATAEKVKLGNPYSKFFVVTETYEVKLDVDPVYSKIDQIFVLRKSNNREEKNPISFDVVNDLYNTVKNHLDRDWSNVETKMKQTGRII